MPKPIFQELIEGLGTNLAPNQSTPEKALLCAIIQRAFHDLTNSEIDINERKTARKFFQLEEHEYGFVWMALQLDWSESLIQRTIEVVQAIVKEGELLSEEIFEERRLRSISQAPFSPEEKRELQKIAGTGDEWFLENIKKEVEDPFTEKLEFDSFPDEQSEP